MMKRCRRLSAAAMIGCGLLSPVCDAQETTIQRGEYLLHAGGCITCHTADSESAIPLAGGRALETPFGIFFPPNITPDTDSGIGNWSDDEFVDAFWNGVGPDGRHYFPTFPYPSYAGVSRDDLLAIKAYLFSREPVYQPNREHELPWYLQYRIAAAAWKLVFFRPARFEPESDRPADWNRGAYLVRHLGHCGECHTPRNRLGATQRDRELAGGDNTPNITPDRDDGIGRWSTGDIRFFLEMGMMPDGDFAGSDMASVIDDNTTLLSDSDRGAIATYLKSLPALKTPPKQATKSE